MTQALDESQPLSLVIPVWAQWPYKQSSHGGRNGGYTQAQQYGVPSTKPYLALVADKCPISQ